MSHPCSGDLDAISDAIESRDREALEEAMKDFNRCMRNYLRAEKYLHRPFEVFTYESPIIELIDDERTLELQASAYENVDKAMVISKGLELAFEKAGIQFDKGKTFAAVLFVIDQPEYLNQVAFVDKMGRMRLSYLTNTLTTKFAGNRIQMDRIDVHK